MAEDFPNTYFCTIDVNKVARLPRQYKIAKMPTFLFFRGVGQIGSYVGGAEAPQVAAELRRRVEDYSGKWE